MLINYNKGLLARAVEFRSGILPSRSFADPLRNSA